MKELEKKNFDRVSGGWGISGVAAACAWGDSKCEEYVRQIMLSRRIFGNGNSKK
ncbi:hypothetical protein ID852_19000 [Xenorhabdus sp. 42]|uniref:hypothetical protein n=1 Tax=Xenorhabdus szentirmaii TaxID=290112 RepID=UPI0019BDDD79|nr:MULTISPECIES: hypothetical protein [unclassified Xenorhabdus]MBD2790906.1 hypothetical protein [Xenorhabdus sp. CUL]MBD2822725.1 hypothetical protein [Xenorhabdus sp. 42]MBD2826779.1 hypothetical protein [Xenorhabdus sp. 5]